MKTAEERIDFENVRRVKAAVIAAIDAGDGVVDLSGVKSADSAALSVLLAAERRALARGLECRIVGLPENLRTLARLYGLEPLLGL